MLNRHKKVSRKIVTDNDLVLFAYVMMFYMVGRISRVLPIITQRYVLFAFLIIGALLVIINSAEGHYKGRNVDE